MNQTDVRFLEQYMYFESWINKYMIYKFAYVWILTFDQNIFNDDLMFPGIIGKDELIFAIIIGKD